MTTPTFIWYGRSPTGADVEVHGSLEGDTASSAAMFKTFDAALAAAGFRRSERFDKPTYGGGGPGKNKRPDLPPPPGILVPFCVHCRQSPSSEKPDVVMRYIKYKKDGAKAGPRTAENEAEMWVCPREKECEFVKSGKSDRAYAYFHMNPDPAQACAQCGAAAGEPCEHRKPPKAAAKSADASKATSAAPGDRPMTVDEKSKFWKAVREMGYSREQVFELAADVLTGQGPSMKDTEFTKITDTSYLSVHKVYTALKEKHDATKA